MLRLARTHSVLRRSEPHRSIVCRSQWELQYAQGRGSGAKAEGYISTGYQRLLTFEVPGGGFSWFGRAPANKILTAYGLMEFHDMSKVSDVDARLIERTRNWLIARQQPDGSWKPDTHFINEGATNHFNSNVLRITAYIAWALADTGYRGPAIDKARQYIQSRDWSQSDAYTLAVIANFAVSYAQNRAFTQHATQAILYFNALAPGQTVILHYRLRANFPIRAHTFQSRVYEYYDPRVSATAPPVELEVSARK